MNSLPNLNEKPVVTIAPRDRMMHIESDAQRGIMLIISLYVQYEIIYVQLVWTMRQIAPHVQRTLN